MQRQRESCARSQVTMLLGGKTGCYGCQNQARIDSTSQQPLWLGGAVKANSRETRCSACEARDDIIVHIAANLIKEVPRHTILIAMLLDRVDLGVKILKIIP